AAVAGRGGRGAAATTPAAGAAAGGTAAAPAAATGAAARGGRGGNAAAPAAGDAHIVKFTAGGSFLLQIGTPGQSDGPDSTTTLNRPTSLALDEAANELYVADTGNRRIIVFDATSGAYKRHWFGSGDKASSAAPAAYDPAAPA